MNFVLIFDSEQQAADRSFQEAAARLGDKHTTEYWWGWHQDPSGKWHLLVDEDTEGAVCVD